MRKVVLKVVGSIVTCLGMLCLMVAPAQAAIVRNGDFETGTLNGWTVESWGEGAWVSHASGDAICFSSLGTISGLYSAASDNTSFFRTIMYQDVRLPNVRRITLRAKLGWFSLMPIVSPDTLEPDPGDFSVNFFRVDVIRKTASLLSVADEDVLVTVFRPTGGLPMDPSLVSAALSRYRGKSVRLRFAVIGNTGQCMTARIDDVRIVAR